MHVSTAKELGMIAAYKELVTVSFSQHQLFLSGPECYQHFHEYAQIDPPIHDEENRIGLWKALTNLAVDEVTPGTDDNLWQLINNKVCIKIKIINFFINYYLMILNEGSF